MNLTNAKAIEGLQYLIRWFDTEAVDFPENVSEFLSEVVETLEYRRWRHRQEDARAEYQKSRGGKQGLPHNAKLTVEQVRTVRRLRKEGVSLKELSKIFGIGGPSISNIINRVSYRNVE